MDGVELVEELAKEQLSVSQLKALVAQLIELGGYRVYRDTNGINVNYKLEAIYVE